MAVAHERAERSRTTSFNLEWTVETERAKVKAIDVSEDGTLIVVGLSSGSIRLMQRQESTINTHQSVEDRLEPTAAQVIAVYPPTLHPESLQPAPVRSVKFHPQWEVQRVFAAGCDDGNIRVFDVAMSQTTNTEHDPKCAQQTSSPITSTVHRREGSKEIVEETNNKKKRDTPFVKKTPVVTLTGHTDYVRTVDFVRRDDAVADETNTCFSNLLLSAGDDKSVILWDWIKGLPLRTMTTLHTSYVTSVAFHPRFAANSGATRLMLTAGLDSKCVVSYLPNRLVGDTMAAGVSMPTSSDLEPETISNAKVVSGGIQCVLWHPHNDFEFVCMGEDWCVKVVKFDRHCGGGGGVGAAGGRRHRWAPRDNAKVLRTLWGHTHFITSGAFCCPAPKERPLLVTSSEDGTVRVWDVDEGSLKSTCRHGLSSSTPTSLSRIWCVATTSTTPEANPQILAGSCTGLTCMTVQSEGSENDEIPAEFMVANFEYKRGKAVAVIGSSETEHHRFLNSSRLIGFLGLLHGLLCLSRFYWMSSLVCYLVAYVPQPPFFPRALSYHRKTRGFVIEAVAGGLPAAKAVLLALTKTSASAHDSTTSTSFLTGLSRAFCITPNVTVSYLIAAVFWTAALCMYLYFFARHDIKLRRFVKKRRLLLQQVHNKNRNAETSADGTTSIPVFSSSGRPSEELSCRGDESGAVGSNGADDDPDDLALSYEDDVMVELEEDVDAERSSLLYNR